MAPFDKLTVFGDQTMDSKNILLANQLPEPDEDKSTRDLSADESSVASDLESDPIPKRDALVLVVDDAVDNAVMLSLHLQLAGYKVITATNGEEAVRVASLARPNIILMDIGMPVMDGLGAVTKIRENETLRSIPVVAVTGFTTAGFQRAAFDVGFDGYVTKPIDLERLHELIRRLLSSQQLSSYEENVVN